MFADKLGNRYIKPVNLFGAVAIVVLAAQSIRIETGLLNIRPGCGFAPVHASRSLVDSEPDDKMETCIPMGERPQ